MLAAVVDPDALLSVIAASLLGGIGVTTAFSLVIFGATRFSELRRDGHPAAAGAFATLAALAFATCVGAVALGIVVMTSK